MEGEERNLIANLLEAEESASALVAEARVEGDKILARARAQADSEFDEKFKEMVSSLEEGCEKKMQELNADHASALTFYKDEISKTKKDTDAFEKFLQSVL